MAKRVGVSEQQVSEIKAYQESGAFNDKEKATLAYAEKVTLKAAGVSETDLKNLQRYYTEDQIVELTLVVCVANCSNRFSDALRIPIN